MFVWASTKWLSGLPSRRLALTDVFLVFSFYHCTLSMIFIINKYVTRTKIVSSESGAEAY